MIESNKVYNEDCLATMKRMNDCIIDLTVTSPPYDNLRTYDGFTFDFKSIAKELYRITKDGGAVVWIVGDEVIDGSETGSSFEQALFFKECGFRLHDTMIYNKGTVFPEINRYYQEFEYMFILTKGSPKTFNPLKQLKTFETIKDNRSRKKKQTKSRQDNDKVESNRFSEKSKNDIYRVKSNIWKYDVGGGKSTKDDVAFEHPAIFPELLAADHINTWSNEGDLIYDCCGGSGTVAKVSHILKRNWILSEISDKYVDIINKRINPYLDQVSLF